MAVFRVERNKGYTVMSNHHLRNKELTLKEKGLLSQMLSQAEDWDYTLAGLSQINRESIDAIRTAVWELEKAGYIKRRQGRDEKGKMTAIEYTIYEQPQPPERKRKEAEAQTAFEIYREIIKENIDYDILIQDMKFDGDRLNEIVDLMLETVCQHYGLDTSDYSFNYIATCSSGRELAELKKSLATIRSTAAELINTIDGHLAEIRKEREAEKAQEAEKEPTPDLAAEPTVTILWSESNQLREGETIPLSRADTLFAVLDEASLDTPRYFKTIFQIDYVMNGKPDHYEGQQDFGDGDSSLMEHIEQHHTYYLNDKEWENYLLQHEGKEALEADKEQRAMLLNEFIRNGAYSRRSLTSRGEPYPNGNRLPYRHASLRYRVPGAYQSRRIPFAARPTAQRF